MATIKKKCAAVAGKKEMGIGEGNFKGHEFVS
jgi:hypothetical protein